MKQAIYSYIKEHPGCRKREIASSMRVWVGSVNFLNAMHELESAGFIYAEPYKDPAQMEYYDKWFVGGKND